MEQYNLPQTNCVLATTSTLNIFFINDGELYFRSTNGIHRSMDITLKDVPKRPTVDPEFKKQEICEHAFKISVAQFRRGDEMPDIIKTCKLCGFTQINNK